MRRIRSLAHALAPLAFALRAAAAQSPATIERGDFRFAYDARGISQLANPHDPFGATLTPAPAAVQGNRPAPDVTLGLTVAYRTGDSAWSTATTRGRAPQVLADGVRYTSASGAPLVVSEAYRTDGRALDWTITLRASAPVRVGDLAISVPIAGPNGATPAQIFERGFLKHQFVSGAGSFVYFVRASGAPPYFLLTARPGTALEYTRGNQLFVHSGKSGPEETRGTWRQPHTSRDLRVGDSVTYAFRMQWANGYDALRDALYAEGSFDVRVVPGMTIPENLASRVALRTRAKIERLTAEFPAQTTIRALPSARGDTRIYEVAFHRLGENLLTIVHDGGRRTQLEFFATEPLDTLIAKRARFLVDRQQVRDTMKWWDGVYAIYDAKAGKVRTIDDPDIFVDRMVYALTCDDPGLSKAPFLAEKNVAFPDAHEIASLEYYISHFVWGGLQRKADETPYPYGVYGTPSWFVNRDTVRRRQYAQSLANGATALRDLDKEHVWRSYDYPHIVMLYLHMYEIAKRYPTLVHDLDAKGYLERAWGTAQAFYTYPYEIYPSYYETYKWGLYNELVVLDLIDALAAEGFRERADWLRGEWEKKVKYFVYDDQYPFRSEYAFDRTAFESSYAFAKYGATHDMQPDSNLWFDVKQQRWYSHPSVRRSDSRAFMDRQLYSGLAVRGWLDPAYWSLGSDPGLSYMAAMGGWGILDYAQLFAPRPSDWLQLGYASYLSSWALMNTGRAETNYGAWFPGRKNDGAAGWQFMSAKAGSAWMGSSVPGGLIEPRGPWHYDGEIDLGFGGALRMAATIVTRDPTFGWIAYGGALRTARDTLAVLPRDGLRRRFALIVGDSGATPVRRLRLALDRDGFAAERPIVVDTTGRRTTFTIENRTHDTHATTLRLALPAGQYVLTAGGRPLPLAQVDDADYPWRASVEVGPGGTAVELRRR